MIYVQDHAMYNILVALYLYGMVLYVISAFITVSSHLSLNFFICIRMTWFYICDTNFYGIIFINVFYIRTMISNVIYFFSKKFI